VAVEGCAATPAVGQAAEEEGGVNAAGVAFAEAGGVVVHDALDGLPGFDGDDGFAVVFVGFAAVFQDADVEFVAEECGVGVEGAVEVEFGVDLGDGRSGSAHFEGLADEGGEVGVGFPAVACVVGAVAAFADVDGNTTEAAGRGAGDAAVLGNDVTQAALDVGGEVGEELLVHPVEGGFIEAACGALGYLVVEGDDLNAAAAQVGAVELGVVNVAGEAGVFPDDEGFFGGLAAAEMAHHGLEAGAPDSRGAGAGFVAEDAGEGNALGLAPGADFGFLLGKGEFLFFAAAVAQVGGDGGTWGKRVLFHGSIF